MKHNRCETDFNEPLMADYLRKNVLDCKAQFIRAPWCSGFGAVPLGLTTYAPNAIEATWRVLKGILDPSFKWQNCGELILKIVALHMFLSYSLKHHHHC